MATLEEELGIQPLEEQLDIQPASGDPTDYLGKEYSFLEALGGGALQGGTFGFADEIEAALRSGAFSGKDYDEALNKSRDQYKMITEQQPVADIIGNIAGGIVPTIGLGAVGAFGKAAQGAKALSTMGKVKEAARAGAIGGAVYGAGSSEEEGADVLKDVAKGGVAGGVAGGTLQAAGSGLKKLASNLLNVTKNNSYIGDAKKVFDQTFHKRADIVDDMTRILESGDDEAFTKLDVQAMEVIEDFVPRLQKLRVQTGQELGAARVKALEDSGKTIDADEIYKLLQQQLDEMNPDSIAIKKVKSMLKEVIDLDQKNLRFIKDLSKKTPMEKGSDALRKQLSKLRRQYGLENIENADPATLDFARQKLAAEGYTPDQIDVVFKQLKEFKPEKAMDVMTGRETLQIMAPGGRDKETGDLIFKPLIQALEPEYTPLKKVVSTSTEFKNLGGEDINNLIRRVNKLYKSTSNPEDRQIYSEMSRKLKEFMTSKIDDPEALKEINRLSDKFKNISGIQERLGLDFAATGRTPVGAKEQAAATKEFQDLLRTIGSYSSPTAAQRGQSRMLKKEVIPMMKELDDSMGTDFQDIIRDLSERGRLGRELGLESQIGGSKETGFFSPKAFTMRTAQFAGKTSRDVADIAGNVAKMSKRFMGLPDDEIGALASEMSGSGNKALQHYGAMLSKAVSQPRATRKATLFSLLQNKDFRDAIAGTSTFGLMSWDDEEVE